MAVKEIYTNIILVANHWLQ